MRINSVISAGSLAMALSIGGLGLGLASCAGSQAASGHANQGMKGGEKSCGQGSCSGEKSADKGAEKSCGEKSAAKGAEKSCGEASCG